VAERTAEAAQRSEELAHRSQQLEALNQQLEETSHHAKRRAAQLATSAQVARAISQVRNLEELLTQVTHLIGTAFDFYHVGIFIVDDTHRYAVLHAANSAGGQTMLARGHRLAVGQQGMVGYVTQTGLPRIALDAGADAVHFDNPDLPDTHSEMTLPLQVGGRILGALDLQTTQAAAFSDEDLAALGTLADQVAVAIVNARLFEQTRQAVDELNALNRRLTGEAWQSYVQTRAPDQVVWHSNDPALAPAPQAEADRPAVGDVTVTPSVPIMLRGQLIGALRFHAPAGQWTDEAQVLATSVAGHLAQAAENARLIEQTQHTAQREKQIAVAADNIHRATDLEEVLRATIAEVYRITGVSDVGIQLGIATADDNGQASEVGL
jgi:GAF domain-containing protein